MTVSEMNERQLLEHMKSKLDSAPVLYRSQVALILDPVIELLERMVNRLDELEEEIDRG
jgi:hypothetical protein